MSFGLSICISSGFFPVALHSARATSSTLSMLFIPLHLPTVPRLGGFLYRKRHPIEEVSESRKLMGWSGYFRSFWRSGVAVQRAATVEAGLYATRSLRCKIRFQPPRQKGPSAVSNALLPSRRAHRSLAELGPHRSALRDCGYCMNGVAMKFQAVWMDWSDHACDDLAILKDIQEVCVPKTSFCWGAERIA